MGSGGKKGRREGGGEETYIPSLPTLRPPFNIFFPAQIFFALPPLSDRLE